MKRHRRIACSLFVLAALLFSQWATASYVCAMVLAPPSASDHAPGCPDMDIANTCEQHCSGTQAATDSGKVHPLADVTDFAPLRVELARPLVPPVALRSSHDIPPDPPPSIRFSVLRI